MLCEAILAAVTVLLSECGSSAVASGNITANDVAKCASLLMLHM